MQKKKLEDNIRNKEAKIREWFEEHSKVLTALSGGVDSCLLACLARKYLGRSSAIAVVGVSPSLKSRDYKLTVDFCKKYDIELIEIDPNEIDDPNYNLNPANRCYYCKTNLYDVMHALQAESFPGFVLVNGNNVSDRSDYRPGLKAADEKQVFSPLAECGFKKEDIRQLARELGLEVWNKPASPCLSSRFPYGESISEKKLKMVERAEDYLSDLGFSDVRVRYLKEGARIEVPESEIQLLRNNFSGISTRLKEFGFSSCEIDEEGLVSGKLNRVLKNR